MNALFAFVLFGYSGEMWAEGLSVLGISEKVFCSRGVYHSRLFMKSRTASELSHVSVFFFGVKMWVLFRRGTYLLNQSGIASYPEVAG